MAAKPIPRRINAPLLRLEPFDARLADAVAGWVRSAEEAYWLAPRTAPPITGAKIRAWNCDPRREPLLLFDAASTAPVGYGEVNLLNAERAEYWLGHLIIDPEQRGRGLGRRLTELLLQRAFRRRGARCVSLVVFVENTAATACYRSAGMHEEGMEEHFFPAYQRRERLVRMARKGRM